MKWYLFALLFAAGFALPAHANLKPSDFFCKAAPLRQPDYFQSQAKSCAEEKGPSAPNGICVEYTYCTYLSREMKAAKVKNSNGEWVKFYELPPAEKIAYMNANVPMSAWLPATLTCAKVSPAGSNECPKIEDCRGDVNFGWTQGVYPAEMNPVYQQRAYQPQNSETFRNKQPSGESAE